MSKLAPAVLLFTLTACTGTTANDHTGSANRAGLPVLPATITLAPGASTDVASANLRIRFDSVTSDSRCPRDVQCVWAGEVTAALTVAQLSGTMTALQLSLSTLPAKDTVTAYGQPLRLLGVQPEAVTTAPIAKSAYRIELRVGKSN